MSRIFYSKPRYQALFPVLEHPHHLLITDIDGLSRAQALQTELQEASTLLLVGMPADQAGEKEVCVRYSNHDALIEQLPGLVKGLPAGTVCYLFGRESFIWPTITQLHALGLAREHCLAERCGPLVRDVVCSHCKQRMQDVGENMVICDGCGRLLWNYDHFSPRLGAYMGFEVNAECPDDIPPREDLQA
jgi:hypothetical protein